MCENLLD